MRRLRLSGLFSGLFKRASQRGEEAPASIKEVEAKHRNRLLAMPGVVSIGIGRDPDGKPAIIVGLDSERPDTFARLPKVLDGYPVRSQVIGPVKAR